MRKLRKTPKWIVDVTPKSKFSYKFSDDENAEIILTNGENKHSFSAILFNKSLVKKIEKINSKLENIDA